ncbi:hypothetical protein BCY91_06710 [Pelobium manganitolerans]|uniref:Uncharacterized protein n=1 Tax=Pelobium manganitolerans TaxID=1842495 RepID=A0A419S517_9SPHI|nr:hypothetical protein BCY91_06710 [Pelobium manganitolerans]
MFILKILHGRMDFSQQLASYIRYSKRYVELEHIFLPILKAIFQDVITYPLVSSNGSLESFVLKINHLHI